MGGAARSPLGIGLIGAGRIGRIHARNVSDHEGARLVAVADAVATVARAVAATHGARAIDDPIALVDDPAVDAVIVCSPTDTHTTLVTACARAGKAVFCEKPLALDLASIDAALAAVDAAGVPLMVGFNRRFDPSFAEVRARLVAGEIGRPELIRITSRDPAPPPIDYVKRSGGIFLDMTIHDLDMARWLAGAEARSVLAAGSCLVDPAIGAAGDIDTAAVTLVFENDVVAVIDNSRRAGRYDQRLEVLGPGGLLRVENPPGAPDFFIDRYAEAYRRELAAFVACARDGAPSPVSGADGRAPVALALAAERSRREGRAVAP